MKNVNPIIAEDLDFSKLLFELEQVNLRLLLELKQQQMVRDTPSPSQKRSTPKQRVANGIGKRG